MHEDFKHTYSALNAKQKLAVDTIDGPLMVIAGPGTGKTQLLSTRAAQIVNAGFANPSNILCLTYTESGATEMRERLTRIMGLPGSDVLVHTFHGFGSLLINQYPEYFNAVKALQPLDDLGRYRIFERLLTSLPLRHQLAVRGEGEQFVRRHAVEEAVRVFKQAGLTPDQLRHIHSQNQKGLTRLQPLLNELFSTTLSAKRLPTITQVVASFTANKGSIEALLLQSLAQAVSESIDSDKTKPIGAWRDSHTIIKDGVRVFKSVAQASLFYDTISLYEQYQAQLAATGRYDYEDMILWAITALQENNDLLLDVAERYQYIMVDEYQDTNGAQNSLLDTLLQAHPLNSPNVMVVGDDDQAIMRFQGAELSGMVTFAETYKPQVIVLDDNYRSSQAIIDAARQIIMQSDERLEVVLPELGLIKKLTAQKEPAVTCIAAHTYDSPSLQYAAIARQVQQLLKQAVPADQIAIIGRKHAELAQFVPHMTARGISTNYDRHENILDLPLIKDLLHLAELLVAIGKNRHKAAALLPSVLANEYWALPPLSVYQLAAQARIDQASWLDTMLASDNQQWKSIAEWLIAASSYCLTANFTQCFDIIIGRQTIKDTKLEKSPFSTHLQPDAPDYLTVLAHLICLRTAVLEARPTAHGMSDLLEVVQEYRLSGLRLVDSNPIMRGDSMGVQVMSAHSSKGREFEHVILLSAVDSVWGAKARGQSQRIRLPENLPLYPAGDSDSDRLRLLYVAITRAKSNVLLSSYVANDAGKPASALSYTQFGDEPGWWHVEHQVAPKSLIQKTLETAWLPHDQPLQRPIQDILQPLLKNYRLSASALRSFLDIRYSGPQVCIEQSVLKFPSAYNAHSALGSATHKSLELAYKAHTAGTPLSDDQLFALFDATLDASGLNSTELEPVKAHGRQFLPAFLKQFAASDFPHITSSEQYATAVLNNIPISGAVDAIAELNKGIRVIDYKTGKPPLPDWSTKGLTDSKKVGLHFYRQQLLFYKLLLDNSPSFDPKVICAELVFVEPSDNGSDLIRLSITEFNNAEIEHITKLISAVYTCITTGNIPSITTYSKDLKGVLAFEADLLNK